LQGYFTTALILNHPAHLQTIILLQHLIPAPSHNQQANIILGCNTWVCLSVCGCVSSSFRVKWSNLLQIKTEILLLPRYMFNFERSKVSDAKMPKWNQDVSHRSLYHLFHCGLGHGKRSLHVGAQRSRSPLQIGRFTSRKSKIFLVGLYARCILVYFKVKCQSQGHKNDKIIFGHNSYRPT